MNYLNVRRVCVCLIALVGGLILFRPVEASAKAAKTITCDPTSLQTLVNKRTGISIATETSIATTSGGTLPYCQIVAITSTDPQAGDKMFVAIDLPDPAFWNGRLLFTGNGGFAGRATPDTIHLALGYAVAATDTGHEATSGTDGSWALNNPTAIKDFQYLGVHDSALLAQKILNGYYDKKTKDYPSYFDSCSTGGRQALVEAQKYPGDFEGIVAGAPAAGYFYLGYNWYSQAELSVPPPAGSGGTLGTGGSYLNVCEINALGAAILQECDGKDGVVDGLIQDPRVCNFDPNTLLCPSGTTCGHGGPPGGCLTTDQIATVNAIWSGPVDTKGNQIYPGFTESDPDSIVSLDISWPQNLAGCTESGSCSTTIDFTGAEPWSAYSQTPVWWSRQDQFLRYFVFSDASYDTHSFSFTDQKSINKVNNVTKKNGADGMDANLKPFVNKGHKLLMYHGWSDPDFSALVSVNYFTSVQQILGASTTDSVRLFMAPGMHHCQGKGPGPNTFDELTPVVNWYEQGVAPDGIIATHYTQDDPTQPVDRTMPLCSYPEQAVWNGLQPVNDASTWSCPSSGAARSQPTSH